MEPTIKWLDDPTVFRVGQSPAHSDHHYFQSVDEVTKNNSSYEQSLDGQWQFNFAANPMKRIKNFYDPNFNSTKFDQIKVPEHIEMAGYSQIHYINTLYAWEGKVYRRPAFTIDSDEQAGSFSTGVDNEVGQYIKHFDLEPTLRNQTVSICFEGVEKAMYVWLNGHFIGYAEDSFTPSEFDLTPYIQPTDNVLAVEVFKHSTASYLEDQDFFQFFGIFRSVHLNAQPAIHVTDLDIKPRLANDNTTGTLQIGLKLASQNFDAATAELTVTDQSQNILALQEVAATQVVNSDQMTFNNVHLWSHNDPYLYNLTVTIKDASGNTLEIIPYNFGFRRIEIKDKIMMLNDQRLLINGTNRHEWNDKTGRCITKTDMEQDLQTFHDLNINADRTSHYPNQIPWYYLCDQQGIYVMAETNLETHGTWQKMGIDEPSYNVPGSVAQWLPAIMDRAKNNYELLKNHTSILFWSLGNESFAGDDLAQMNQYYKTVDPSRLTHYEGVFHNTEYRDRISDVESRMYDSPTSIAKYLSNNPDKPFLSCEFMHDMGNSLGGMKDYDDLYDQFPMYQGGFIWDFKDQALLVNDEVTGQPVLRYGGDFDDRHSDYEFSGDGLLFADHTLKPATQEVAYYYGKREQ
ncbi:glycoside hydrolase family 2 TIM barrel-domain containing protein [Paucilactobacillus kaifaensis]|uniref:glycoside hydrolase family 2 TIM barrel-domain containing protein n=1 Tax=Paucilactobacillus kaifaensis TaxID=2559921 RepID=UPI0010F76468|nr:glycoside hydrolase family 2 TIM barrel-domain containing protein [Paucilactobacillus kaifaensis]